MIVVDTNVIGYLFLASEQSAQAELAFRKDPHWAAPLLWRSEMRNVLAFYIRRKRLALPDALQIMEAATGLMAGREYEISSLQVLKLAFDSSCSAYDCEFVALALELAVPLVTVDRQILAQFPAIAMALDSFAAPA